MTDRLKLAMVRRTDIMERIYLDTGDKEKCCGCGACRQACPKDCISMRSDEYGFLYPEIDSDKCIHCDKCRRVCPMVKDNPENDNIICYAAVHRDDKVVMKSTSGGAFYAIAHAFFEKYGRRAVVFGVEFEEDFTLITTYVDSIEALEKYHKSKYIQSDIRNSYAEAKNFLKNSYHVLFVGTPCQIAGLRTFCSGVSDENLLCVDLVCHGVFSPGLFKNWISGLEKKYKKPIASVDMRGKKKYGDKYHLFDCSVRLKNGEIVSDRLTNSFINVFTRGIGYRDCCFSCPYASMNRQGDITLGDFWGVEDLYPGRFADKGVSLIILSSDKGRAILESLEDCMDMEQISIDDARQYNHNLKEPTVKKSSEETFRRMAVTNGGFYAVKKISQPPLKTRIKNKIVAIAAAVIPNSLKRFIKKII